MCHCVNSAVHFEFFTYIRHDKLESIKGAQMVNISQIPGRHIVYADNRIATFNQRVAQMRTKKSCAACNYNAHI